MKELKLQISDSTFNALNERADSQGVSIEALCISIIQQNNQILDPGVYPSLGSEDIRVELKKVFSSALSREEKSRRVKLLESQIVRRIR